MLDARAIGMELTQRGAVVEMEELAVSEGHRVASEHRWANGKID